MRYHFLFIISTLILTACGVEEEPNYIQPPDWTKDNSSDMHSVFAAEEEDEINLFLKRHSDWKMTRTGTGLRYMIYSKSNDNDTVKAGDIVLVDFEMSLLDGTICYSSYDKHPEDFMVEKSDIESGLHEGIKYMCKDDRAKFILPSHIAHGLIGDTEKIPPLTPVIYDIHLIDVAKRP